MSTPYYPPSPARVYQNDTGELNDLTNLYGTVQQLSQVVAQLSGQPGLGPDPAMDALRTVLATSTGLAGLPPSGDTTGAADPAAVQALLNLGGHALLRTGTFYIGGSATLALPVTGSWLSGAGYGTTLQVVSGFTGPDVITPGADGCTISDLAIVGASTTIASNPNADAIQLVGRQHCRIRNVFWQYINGYAINAQASSSRSSADLVITNPIIRNCAAGIHCLGVTGSSFLGEYFLSNVQMQQMGTASGPNAGLDALLIEDISDVLVQGVNIGTASGTLGGAIHVLGACATIRIVSPDCGSNGATGVAPVFYVNAGTNGTPTDVQFIGGASEGGGSACLQVDAGGDILFLGGRTHQAYGTGFVYNGGEVEIVGWSFAANNQSAGTCYDVDTSGASSGSLRVADSRFETSIATGTAGSVPQTANVNSRAYFRDSFFLGSGTAPSNVFNGTPQQVVNCVGYNPRGSVTAATITASPFSTTGYQTPLMVIFTAINGMTQFAIGGSGGVAVPLPVVGVPYYIGVRQALNITWATTAPTWQWFGL
jgi:hypothetical protein